jgi:trigger factor
LPPFQKFNDFPTTFQRFSNNNMATISRDSIGNLHDKVFVKLAKEDYYPQFEKSLKGYAKQANVPGFRKGMVPAGMVKKMYGQSLFQDEVLRTAGKQLEDYLNAEKVGIFGQPMIMLKESAQRLDMNNPQELDFAFEIGLKPDFQIPALDGAHSLTHYKVQVSDAMVEDEIQRMARRYGKTEDQDTVTHGESILYTTYTPTDAVGNPVEGATPVEDTVILEKLPAKLQELLMGKKAGDTILFTPVDVSTAEELPGFMKDSLKMDVAAATQHYELAITKVALLIPREQDIMFYGEVFPNDNIMDEAAFRAKVREELGREFDRAAENRINDEIYEMLVHSTPMQLPVTFLKRWMREGQEKPLSEAQVEKDFPGFDHQLRWTLISDKLIQEGGITVDKEEVLSDMKGRVLAYFGMDADDEAPWMDGYMQKMAKDDKTMNETYRQMLFSKLFTWLRSKFRVEEKEVTEQEFFALPNAHAAHHHDH